MNFFHALNKTLNQQLKKMLEINHIINVCSIVVKSKELDTERVEYAKIRKVNYFNSIKINIKLLTD